MGRKRKEENMQIVHYSEEVADKICALISDSYENSVYNIADIPGMPSASAVVKWRNSRPEFAKKYDAAKKIQYSNALDFILHKSKELLLQSGLENADVSARINYLHNLKYVIEKTRTQKTITGYRGKSKKKVKSVEDALLNSEIDIDVALKYVEYLKKEVEVLVIPDLQKDIEALKKSMGVDK